METAKRTHATLVGVGLIVWSVGVATPVSGNTLVVSNTFDRGPGSLRDAIASAAPGDTIQAIVGGAITLTGGPLVVGKDLSIVGPGAASLTIAGSGSTRVFTIDAATATVSISGVTISNGRGDYGGGILTGGRVTLTDCVLSSNAAAMFGGAIFNSGTLTLVRSLVSNNAAEYRAGAIYSETGSTLTLDHANLFGNSSSVGGAIDNHDGTLSITASTLSGNVATGVHGGAGGAIHNGGLAGTVTIVGSTIASNVAAWEGGGIYTGSGTVTVENSTIANNASTCDFGGCSGGGGIYTNSAPVSINSSTLSNNTSRTGGNIISLYNGAKTCDLVPATIALFQTTGTVVGPVTLSTYTLAADSGSDFKVDATACQYVYNLSTASLGSGTYSVKILIGGTIVGAATFGVQ